MLTRREVKYTSAAPRCTCLPPRQHCAGVALGSPPPTPQHCWFGRRTSTTRLRLVVLASSSSTMLWSCTRWTSDSNAMLILRKDKYTSAAPLCTCLPPHQHWTEVALGGKQVHLGFASVYLLSSSCNFSSSPPRPSPGTTRLRLVVPELGLGGLEWSLWWPPRTTSAQVHRGQVQVPLGFASLYLDLALVDLSGVGGGLPRATPAEVVQVKLKSNSASPRWTSTWPGRLQPESVKYTSATVRFILEFFCSSTFYLWATDCGP